jgi:membrane protease YdiL (CAAX protease family)
MLSGRSPTVGALLVLVAVVMIAVLVFAARRAGWIALAYLALVRPRGRYVLAAILCVIAPLLIVFAHAQFDIRQIVPPEQFGAAIGRNILHLQFYLLVLSAVIAMPVMEEVVFRGFVYRGFSETRIGVAGAIVITSLVWALIHIDKSPAQMFDTAIHGIIWGWLRWYTGSLWVAIGVHIVNNALAVLLTVAAMYGLFG